MTSSSAATPPASGTPMDDEGVAEHADRPVDGCSRRCCRITFTDHLGAVKVWSWMRSQWEAEQDPECE